MRKLTFGMNLSLDGYIAAPGDDLGWSVPTMEVDIRPTACSAVLSKPLPQVSHHAR
ncbi:hypothetical protein [Micromonospora arborensis]|uniref:hypothetical protein n=1 Tax=Micromonospora arborensis TaxID=2116518 RepID=UPI001FC9CAB5|nr:hypothetical protein [Micromonospora arborensis]